MSLLTMPPSKRIYSNEVLNAMIRGDLKLFFHIHETNEKKKFVETTIKLKVKDEHNSVPPLPSPWTDFSNMKTN